MALIVKVLEYDLAAFDTIKVQMDMQYLKRKGIFSSYFSHEFYNVQHLAFTFQCEDSGNIISAQVAGGGVNSPIPGGGNQPEPSWFGQLMQLSAAIKTLIIVAVIIYVGCEVGNAVSMSRKNKDVEREREK